jgi:beta-glucosidase
MLSRTLLFAISFATAVFAAPLNLIGTVKALNEDGSPIKDAVVLLKVNGDLVAYARTLSKQDGKFTLLPNKDAPGEITQVAKQQTVLPTQFASYHVMDLKGKICNSLNNLPQGIYVLLGKTEDGKNFNLGTLYHKGGTLNPKPTISSKPRILSKTVTTTVGEVQLIVRKVGFLPKEVDFSNFDEDVGTVVLERDPLEDRIDSVMALMSLEDKIYQMTQSAATTSSWTGTITWNLGAGNRLYGSVLHGGDTYRSDVLANAYTALQNATVKIPVTYGKDMMHGAAAIVGATVFPHNIGMGATRDSALVRRACEITAQESWVGNVDLIFGPAISVPQNQRWGRTYEGFGEEPELAVEMGAACVRGYQGEKYNAPWRVIATAKHYLADGGTANGKDRGNVTVSDNDIRRIHLPGYEAAVEQGVLSVMASFNQINGKHQHVDSLRLTGWLKTELGFDGYIISDWQGIANSTNPGFTEDYNNPTNPNNPSLSPNAVRDAINAGIDLAMEPGSHIDFISRLTALVPGSVSIDRINDAVRRILRAKFRAGRMDNPESIGNTVKATYGDIGSAAHRDVAREAVRKSLVLLKNENNVLPIPRSGNNVFVMGTHANDHGYQCGGWTSVAASAGSSPTNGWQGASGSMNGATSIQAGIDIVAPGARVNDVNQANIIIYVTGEKPYAEWKGDSTSLAWNDNNTSQLNTYKSQNKKIVTVFISGRAREATTLMNASDAFVAAWLPGSEGAGVADVLFGGNGQGEYNFTGKLPVTWSTEFPYGFGLSY